MKNGVNYRNDDPYIEQLNHGLLQYITTLGRATY